MAAWLSSFGISFFCVLCAGLYSPIQELWHAQLTTSWWAFSVLFIAMRKTLLHSAVLLILAGMLGGQITELFDHWDKALSRDVDYTVVIIAACLGLVFTVGKKLVSPSKRLLAAAKPVGLTRPAFPGFQCISPQPLATGPPISDLSPLRI